MKGTLEKLRRMFSAKKRIEDDVTVSRFARSTSFKKASMRRSGRRAARKKAVVTNRGIYYVDDEGREEEVVVTPGETELPGTLESQSTQSQGTISYTDWIQISDDDTLDKAAGSRNFSLEGKSVPFDSPLPGGGGGGGGSGRGGKAASESPVSRPRRSPPTDDGLPVTSTFGSSCTSGVHSMEKPRLEDADEESRWGRGGARRRQPTVVATRDNLRRSLRRLSGKRAKKAARRPDADTTEPKPLSVMDDEFYRRFARLPLVYANDDAPATPTSPTECEATTPTSPTRPPFAFSRQNPITRWLEESEKMSPRAGFTDTDRPLWSELVSRPPRPAEDRARRPAKSTKRSSRARTPSRKSMRRKAAKVARPRVDRIRSVVGDGTTSEDTVGASTSVSASASAPLLASMAAASADGAAAARCDR